MGNSRLYKARQRRGWTRKEVADQIGATPDQVWEWEQGVSEPPTYFKGKLCDLYNLDTDKLGFLRSNPKDKNKRKRNSSSSVMNVRNRTGGKARRMRRG